MKRITILAILIVGFAGLATASNGQEKILEREINEMLLINSEIQGNSDSCAPGLERVCRSLSSSADERAEVLRDFDTIDNSPEEKERGLRTVRESIRSDIELLEENDLSEDTQLSRSLELSYDFEKDANRALRAANTLGVISTAKECPKKCGPSVSQQAKEAQDYNSSRSNKRKT